MKPRLTTLVSKVTALGLATLAFAACGDDGTSTDVDAGDDPVDAPPGPQTIILTEDITTSTTFTKDNVYKIPRLKQLFVQPGATLTLEPGTTIQGGQGSVLVITRGAKIMAVGTAAEPITLTTDQPEGQRTSGYWGGLLILGGAPINVNVNSTPPATEATFEAFTSAIPEGKFGGTNPADDSGKLKYVRIQFAGFNFVADREFNNLTLCGVGSGTEIDYVQVHGGTDDGVEFFGGTVNVKHIVSSQNGDDGLDTDNGWNGKGQFIVVQNTNPQGATEASNGYESDNHSTAASYETAPRTRPTLYNVTLLGKKDYAGGSSFATVLRRGTGGNYYNHIVMDFPRGLEFRDVATKNSLDQGNLFFKNSIIFNNAASGNNWEPPQASNDINEESYMTNAAWSNRFVDPGLPAARTSLTAPDWKPAAGAAALTGGATPPSDGFFDTTATFVGAIGADDWTQGWTAYPQPRTP
jgi:hypothetical protein